MAAGEGQPTLAINLEFLRRVPGIALLLGGSPALSFLPCAKGSRNVDGDGVAVLLLGFRLFLAFWGNFDISTGMGVGFSLCEMLGGF